MRILVTGAGGFVGRSLIPGLVGQRHEVLSASRSPASFAGALAVPMPELGPEADYSRCLEGVDVVIHLAGRAHVVSETPGSDLDRLYFKINTEGTRALAAQASASGASQFIFLSSCHAVAAAADTLLTEKTEPRPCSAYGRSKLAAEQALKAELSNTGCAYTILRPPLVYGPGNLANFARLINLVKSGIPLPFASVKNRRSFLGVRNLTDLLGRCIGNEKAKNRTFFPSDGADVSTPELMIALAGAFGFQARLFPFPGSLLTAASRLPGMDMLRKLTASLFVDSQPLKNELGWIPPLTLSQGLRQIAGAGNGERQDAPDACNR
ncbi:MAG: NAD-dependent epimerase/dehydratase family protein [Terrimicrobiaceae bacterium]